MSDPVIQVKALGKRYQLGSQTRFDQTLPEAISMAVRRVVRWRRPSPSCMAGWADRAFWALRDVNFAVDPGEVVGIIGQNGAGKSTLLKILSQITDPTEGQVVLRGRVASLLEVGTGFHPELTGRENIYLNGSILGMARREIRAKFDQIVAFSGVETFLDTPIKRYSSGMTVRLAFSVAAHLDPEILIVDEVLSVGDAAFQNKCLGKMQDVASSGRTVLFVTHNMGMIGQLCDRCIMLEDGLVVRDGESGQVINHYLFSGMEGQTQGQVRWSDVQDAPGGQEVKLHEIVLRDATGLPQNKFEVDRPIEVQITYCVKQPLCGMRVVMQLLTQDGTVALTSTDHAIRTPQTPPGWYTSLCTIPSRLLNHGRYLVSVNMGIPGIKVLVPAKPYLWFDTCGPQQHGSFYPEAWPGAVAPPLRWQTNVRVAERTTAA